MGKGGEMSSGKGDESGGYENPNYPVVVGEDGVPRIGACAVDPLQSFKSTELQMWPIFGNKLSFLARPHMRAFHFQWLSFFMAFMVWFAYAPLLVVIRQDLDIPKKGIWMSNVFNVAACVVVARGRAAGRRLRRGQGPDGLAHILWDLHVLRGFVNPLWSSASCASSSASAARRSSSRSSGPRRCSAKNVVGAANAMTGGWGNCGGGMAIMIMGRAFMRGSEIKACRRPRRPFYIPAVAVMLVAVCMLFFSDECPSGKLTDALARATREGDRQGTSAGAARSPSILFVQRDVLRHLVHSDGMAMYFKDTYPVSLALRGARWLIEGGEPRRRLGVEAFRTCARELGGSAASSCTADWFAEGAILVIFSRPMDSIAHAAITLVLFSCCVQAARSPPALRRPYVAPKALGSVSGVVGAGGNLGAVAWGLRSCSATAARRATATWASSSWPLLCCRSSSRSMAAASSATTTRLRGCVAGGRGARRRPEFETAREAARARGRVGSAREATRRPLSVGCSPVPSIVRQRRLLDACIRKSPRSAA